MVFSPFFKSNGHGHSRIIFILPLSNFKVKTPSSTMDSISVSPYQLSPRPNFDLNEILELMLSKMRSTSRSSGRLQRRLSLAQTSLIIPIAPRKFMCTLAPFLGGSRYFSWNRTPSSPKEVRSISLSQSESGPSVLRLGLSPCSFKLSVRSSMRRAVKDWES